ncbi:MAG: hypothetical protein Q7S03_01715 [bacterium]|nr:hypothetical protein [bacterium]
MVDIGATEQIETPILEKVLNPEEIKGPAETAIMDIRAIKEKVKRLAPDATSTRGTVGGLQYTFSMSSGGSETLCISNWEETNTKEIIISTGSDGVQQRPLLRYTEFKREKPGEPAKERIFFENTDKAEEQIRKVIDETKTKLGINPQQQAA